MIPSTQPRTEADVETQPLAPDSTLKAEVKLKSLEGEKVLYVGVWIVLSATVVIFNKWMFTTGGFPYPLALTSLHMTACFVVFGAVRHFAPTSVRLAIMPDSDVVIPRSVYLKNFLAISCFYAGTLGTGNLAYMFSSVAFIQMMKPMNCIFASLACFALGIEEPTRSHIVIVCTIALGVALATKHDAFFSLAGCLLQCVSSMSEGCRLSLMQYVTANNYKLDPVTTVYNFSFASAVLLGLACYAIERPITLKNLYSPWVLALNCVMAVALNVLVANVIKKTSAVVFALSGIVKDIGLIVVASLVFMTPITPIMLTGYSVSVAGLCMYKAYKDNLAIFKEQGFFGGMREVCLSPFERGSVKS